MKEEKFKQNVLNYFILISSIKPIPNGSLPDQSFTWNISKRDSRCPYLSISCPQQLPFMISLGELSTKCRTKNDCGRRRPRRVARRSKTQEACTNSSHKSQSIIFHHPPITITTTLKFQLNVQTQKYEADILFSSDFCSEFSIPDQGDQMKLNSNNFIENIKFIKIIHKIVFGLIELFEGYQNTMTRILHFNNFKIPLLD